MNIILKAFDGTYCKPIVEHALKGMELGTCVCILNDKREWPELNAKEQIWLPAGPQRAGDYTGVDWNGIEPLDEELIESMRHCEAMFLRMVDRYARKEDIPYPERRRQYMRHLRFWNDLLDKKKIDLVMLYTVPHQCYDYVLYCLCKKKGVPLFYLERAAFMDALFLVEDWEESATDLRDRHAALSREFADPAVPVPLSAESEAYVRQFTEDKNVPWFSQKEKPRMQKSFVQRWWKTAFGYLVRKPGPFLRSVLSPRVWQRKIRQHHIHLRYENNVRMPDLTKPYVYLPLHMQPEATTCPMAGAYTDQECIVELLASVLPLDVRIYVKEHPFQSEICRSDAFYDSMIRIPSVTFVPKTFDSFALTEHSLAVATATGTAGFEALFAGKPVLLFGHRFFQYAPGVHPVRSAEDCLSAMQAIVAGKGKPDPRSLRIFLKAMEDCSIPYVGSHPSPYGYTQEERAQIMGATIGKKIRSLHLS